MKIRLYLMLLTTIMIASCFGGGPAGTVKSFYKEVESGKLESATELLSNSTRSQLSADKLKLSLQEGTRQIDAKGGIEKIVVTEEKVIGETATVAVKILFADDTEQVDQISLIQEDGKWRIQISVSRGK